SIGTSTLEAEIQRLGQPGSNLRVLPGDVAFRLYDTFGLPLDLTRDIAAEKGFTVDEAGFEREMDAQRERARRSWQGGDGPAQRKGPALHGVSGMVGRTEFVGHREVRTDDSRILAM